jgi:hypothetical protein
LAHKRFEKSGTPLGRVTVFQATVKDSRVWTPYRPGARWENEKKIWPKVLSVDLGKLPPPERSLVEPNRLRIKSFDKPCGAMGFFGPVAAADPIRVSDFVCPGGGEYVCRRFHGKELRLAKRPPSFDLTLWVLSVRARSGPALPDPDPVRTRTGWVQTGREQVPGIPGPVPRVTRTKPGKHFISFRELQKANESFPRPRRAGPTRRSRPVAQHDFSHRRGQAAVHRSGDVPANQGTTKPMD